MRKRLSAASVGASQLKSPISKIGHLRFKNRPLGSETGHYPAKNRNRSGNENNLRPCPAPRLRDRLFAWAPLLSSLPSTTCSRTAPPIRISDPTTWIAAPKPDKPNVSSPDFRTSAMPSRSHLWRHHRLLFLLAEMMELGWLGRVSKSLSPMTVAVAANVSAKCLILLVGSPGRAVPTKQTERLRLTNLHTRPG